jgi:hypothetical protein
MDGNLVLCSHQIDLGEEGTAEKLVGVVVEMLDGIAVADGPGIQCLYIRIVLLLFV